MSEKFRKTAPKYMKLFIADFSVGLLDASASFGNFGHESNGFENLQEIGKVPPKGGYGWPQWTGSRRVDYFAYCERNGYDPASDDSNYKYIFVELKYTWEKKAIPALLEESDLYAKTRRFCNEYERPGVKAYESRYTWADRAYEYYMETYGEEVGPPELGYPDPETEPKKAIMFANELIARAIPYLKE